MNRLVEVLGMLRTIVMWNAWHNKKIGFVLKFNKYLKKMVDTNEVMMWYKKIQCIWKWFEEIRKVLNKNGEEIKIVRNNGIEELNHRWSRMHIRRRTGRSRTTKEMEKYGALLAVFSNIENEEFIKTVLGDVKDFVRDIQEVTESEVLEARRLIRTFPQSPLIRSDSERPGILREFIRLIDDAFEDVLDRDVEGWLSNF